MPTNNANTMRLSCLCFNLLGAPFIAPRTSLRFKKIAEIIESSQVNIVCLQEVMTYYHLFLLKRHLPSYTNVLYKKFFYGPKGGLVIFSKIPLEKVAYKTYSKLGNFKNKSIYSKFVRNGVLLCKVKNMPLFILNTQVITDFEFDWSSQNRFYQSVSSQVDEAAKIINNLSEKGHAVLAAGDFNIAKGAKLYLDFLNNSKAVDLFGHYSHPTYYRDRLNYLFKGKKSDRIDFIFLKNNKRKIDVISTSHILDKEVRLPNGSESFLSDHIGLKVDLSCHFG